MPICGNNIRVIKMSKSYFEIRKALEVGTNKIVDEYKKATPGQVAEAPEDDMPASPDEAGMAMDQAKFIGYVANEIKEYIGGNKEFPEWMQNKLTGLHEKAKDMHAVMAGKYNESVDEGMKPDRLAPGWMLRQDPKLKAKVDANRAKNKEFEKSVGTKVDRVPKGEYDRKVDSYLKKKYNKEEVELVDEATTIHLPKKYMQGGSEMEDQVSAAIHKAAGSPKMHSIEFKFGVRFEVERDGKKDQKLTDILRKNLKEEVAEAVDKSSDVYKEYLELKKKSIKELRDIIKRIHRVVDVSGYDKQGAISDILRSKHGNKKVAAAMGLDEEVELVDEANLDELSQATLRSYHGKASAQAQKAKEVVKKNMAAKSPTAGSTAKAGKAYSTFSKRVKGLNRSADKMEATDTKRNEEVLNELSKNTLLRYNKKAVGQIKKGVVSGNKAMKRDDGAFRAQARIFNEPKSPYRAEATVTEVNDRAQERDAQINKVLGPTKNAAQAIEALKKAFKVNDAEAKKMLAQAMKAMSESSAISEAIDMSKAGKYARVMNPKTREIKKVLKTDLRKYVDMGWTHMTQLKNRLTKEVSEAVNFHVRMDHLKDQESKKVVAILQKAEKSGSIKYKGESDKGILFSAKSEPAVNTVTKDIAKVSRVADVEIMENGDTSESSKAYGKALEKQRDDKKNAGITDKDKVTLAKLRAMMAKEKK